jgi:hypothetical protein
MKTCVAATLLFFGSLNQCYSQNKPCLTYDYGRSVWAIQRYLTTGDNLEYLTGDYHFGKLFDIDKKQLMTKTDFIPLPSMWIDYQGTKTDTAKSLKQLLKPHYQIYTGFLLESDQLVTLLRSGYDVPPGSKKIKMLGGSEDIESKLLYDLYKTPDVCIFFEPLLRTYAYVQEIRLFYFDVETKSIKSLTKQEYINHYSSLNKH